MVIDLILLTLNLYYNTSLQYFILPPPSYQNYYLYDTFFKSNKKQLKRDEHIVDLSFSHPFPN